MLVPYISKLLVQNLSTARGYDNHREHLQSWSHGAVQISAVQTFCLLAFFQAHPKEKNIKNPQL